jgi:hypothetical protein
MPSPKKRKTPSKAQTESNNDGDHGNDSLEAIREELAAFVRKVERLEQQQTDLLRRNAALTEEKMVLEESLGEAKKKAKLDMDRMEQAWKTKVLLMAEKQRHRFDIGAAPAPVEVESMFQQKDCCIS